MSLHQIVYVSSACSLMGEPELKDLLTQSRQFNAAQHISGLLLYNDGNFIQLLEGDESVLHPLMNRINEDRRHFGLSVLVSEPAEKRLFADWAMGFRSISPETVGAIPGYSDFLAQPRTLPTQKERCWKLLNSFRRSM